jgi:hypothetical protein
VYETLLFLHVLSAFALVAGLVLMSAAAVGAPIGMGPFTLGNRLTEIGATLALIFGVWIAIKEDFYDITDGWIIGAIGLWIVATALGTMAGRAMPEGEFRVEGRAALLHWAAVAATVGILVLMIWKPGAGV